MVRGSKPQFSIGIYGKWGTGKTTLMKMVEKKLNTFVKKEVLLGTTLQRIIVKTTGSNRF